jgi:hypothetical protein
MVTYMRVVLHDVVDKQKHLALLPTHSTKPILKRVMRDLFCRQWLQEFRIQICKHQPSPSKILQHQPDDEVVLPPPPSDPCPVTP